MLLSSDRQSEAGDARPTLQPRAHADEGGLKISRLQNVSELTDFKEEWRRLEALSEGQFAYFQSYDWCVSWCRHYLAAPNSLTDSTASGLSVFVAERDGRVVMIWPMLQTETAFRLRLLTFIGDELGQYSSILVDPGAVTGEDVASCWKWILASAQPDVVALDNVPASVRLAAICGEAGITVSSTATAMMDLASFASRECLDASISATTRRNRRKRRNKLAGGRKLALKQVDGGTAEFRDMVRLAFAWKREWLAQTGRFNANISDDRAMRFVADLSEGAVALVLQRDGAPIALEIGFRRGDHYYSYIGAFDWSLRNLSPGKVQMEETLGWLIDNDMRYFDLLGNPSGYKQDWSNVEVGLQTVLHPMTLKGYAYAIGWRQSLKPAMKSAFYALPIGVRLRLLGQVFCIGRDGPVADNPPVQSRAWLPCAWRNRVRRSDNDSVAPRLFPIYAWTKWQGSIINILLAGLVAGAGFDRFCRHACVFTVGA